MGDCSLRVYGVLCLDQSIILDIEFPNINTEWISIVLHFVSERAI